MQAILHMEIDVFCIIILIMLLYKIIKIIENKELKTIIISLFGWALVMFVFDGLYGMTKEGVVDVSKGVMYIINVMYFLALVGLPYEWFHFCQYLLDFKYFRTTSGKVLSAVPSALFFVLIATNSTTGYLFYINDDIEYCRGELYFIHLICCYIYMLVPVIQGLWAAIVSNNKSYNKYGISILAIITLPFAGGMAQALLPNTQLLNIGLTIGLLQMYLYILSSDKERIIEEQKEVLRDALSQAELASKAKTSFLANVSHDIRTPMNAIMGFTALAERQLDDLARVKEYLGKIESSGNTLLGLINDVLDISSIESGKNRLVEAPSNIIDVVSQVKNNLMHMADKKNITIVIDGNGIKDFCVKCDSLRLTQIFMNLMSNAVKYTPEGGHIEAIGKQLNTERTDGKVFYEFIVRDNGIGMSEKFIDKIFEPFERETESGINKVQGTGLGLSITKMLVDMMGGTILVKSTLGKGSTFIIRMPFEVVNMETSVHNESTENDVCDISGMKILLVDDNEINREIVRAVLEEENAIVTEAVNGKEAVDLMRSASANEYDVILMDVQMPVMDGYNATKIIREMYDKKIANTPIIALTANAFKEDKDKALEAGMNAHITKPIEVAKLISTISTIKKN